MTAIRPARDALTGAETALRTLHARCCEPDRSPAMVAIGETLTVARSSLDRLEVGKDTADPLFDALEEAGAQIGRLQIGCCAAARMPLYAEILERLTEVQLEVSRALGTGH